MGGGGGPQTQTATPWSGQQPYLTDLFRQAQGLYNQGPQQFYPGNLVAPFSPQSQLGMDMMTQRALGGSPYQDALGGYLTRTLGQGNIDPMQIAQGGFGAMSGIAPGQQMIQQAGQAGPSFGQAANLFGVGGDVDLAGASQFAGGAVGPYAQALQGMTGYGTLGEAGQFAGQAQPGALPASRQFVQQALGGISPDFLGTSQAIQQQTGLGQSVGLDPTAAGQLGQTAGGGYLGSNPYLDQVFDTAAEGVTSRFQEDVMPALAAQFGAAGRTGSGAQALMTGRAAGDVAAELRGLAGDIYAPAYESERNRQVQAAGQLGGLGLEAAGLGQQGTLGALGIGSDVYGRELGQQLGAAQLGGDLFSRLNQADMSRLGLASDLYLGERGLGQQAAQAAGQLGLSGGQLAADLYGTGLQGELGRLGMAGDMFSGGLDRQLAAGGALGQLGLGGMGALGDLYGSIGEQQFRAGSLTPSAQAMDYADIDRLMQVGGMTEDQAQRLIDAEQQRFMFNQQAPWQNLANYSNVIYGLPAGYGTTTGTQPSGSRLSGAAGGAMAGAALGPWGILGGAILGGLM